MRLAAIKHVAALRRIGVSQGSSAIDQGIAAFDDMSGLAQTMNTRARIAPACRDAFRRFVVSSTAGANHVIGALDVGEFHVEPREND